MHLENKKEGGKVSEELKHSCGIFAIFAKKTPDLAWLTVRALDGQQTRGQEGAGIASTDGKNFHIKKGRGLVVQVFPNAKSVRNLEGFAAIGHVRYSTTGRDKLCNVQPLFEKNFDEEICLAHNGNLLNAASLRQELEKAGEVFKTTTDSEVIAKLIVRETGTWVARLRRVMERLVGSYCLAVLTKDQILLCRDPTGNRPLTIGRIDGLWEAASESGVFKNQPSEFVREVDPGEIVVFDQKGISSFPKTEPNVQKGLCSFEWYYFMRPDSVFGGLESAEVRERAGRILAENYPVGVDFVVPVPRSGFYAADGFSEVSGIPIKHAIVSNLNKRVFLNPNAAERGSDYDIKYSVIQSVAGKNLALIDDSVVRGNSNNRVLKLLKNAGAREIHLFLTYYQIIKPCNFGIDMATEEELIAAQVGKGKSKEEVEKFLAAHWEIASVHFLSRGDVIRAIGLPEKMICTGCGGGRYPIEAGGEVKKDQFELVTV